MSESHIGYFKTAFKNFYIMGLNDWEIEQRQRGANLALTKYYNIAQQACSYAVQALASGPTNQGLLYWLLVKTDKAVFETEKHKRLVETRKEYEKIFKETGLYNDVTAYLLKKESFPKIAEYAKKAKTGACGEYAAVVFEYLRTEHGGGLTFNLEFIRFMKPSGESGHYAVVINRDFGTDLTALNKWNTTAYICDSWNGKVWTWNEFAFGMFGYLPEVSLSLPHNGTPHIYVKNWMNW